MKASAYFLSYPVQVQVPWGTISQLLPLTLRFPPLRKLTSKNTPLAAIILLSDLPGPPTPPHPQVP